MTELTVSEINEVDGGLVFLAPVIAAAPSFLGGVAAGLGAVGAGVGIYVGIKSLN